MSDIVDPYSSSQNSPCSADVKRTTMNNMVAGTIGGLAGVIAGHPFDTLKVGIGNIK